MRRSRIFATLVLALAVVASGSWAQEPSSRPVLLLGAKGGGSLANVSATSSGSSVSTDSRSGINGGGIVGLEFSTVWSVQLEGIVTPKGFESSTGSGSLDMSYLDLPVLLVFTLPTSSFILPRVYTGPVFSLRLNCDQTLVPNEIGNTTCDPDQSTTADFGVEFGAGVKLGRGFGLTLDVAYILGLTNILQSPLSNDNSIKNRALYVQIGFLVPVI